MQGKEIANKNSGVTAPASPLSTLPPVWHWSLPKRPPPRLARSGPHQIHESSTCAHSMTCAFNTAATLSRAYSTAIGRCCATLHTFLFLSHAQSSFAATPPAPSTHRPHVRCAQQPTAAFRAHRPTQDPLQRDHSGNAQDFAAQSTTIEARRQSRRYRIAYSAACACVSAPSLKTLWYTCPICACAD